MPVGEPLPPRLRRQLAGVKSLQGRGRFARLATGIVAIIAVGAVVSACGNSGLTLARQACTHVDRSITLLHQAQQQPTVYEGTRLDQQAYDALRAAMPIAAEAAYHDGQWQALMTSLSESDRVPEATLVPSLQAECSMATNSIFDQAPPPSSIPAPSGT